MENTTLLIATIGLFLAIYSILKIYQKNQIIASKDEEINKLEKQRDNLQSQVCSWKKKVYTLRTKKKNDNATKQRAPRGVSKKAKKI